MSRRHESELGTALGLTAEEIPEWDTLLELVRPVGSDARLLAIESAAHALCDAVGPGGIDAPPEVTAALERLGLALAMGR